MLSDIGQKIIDFKLTNLLKFASFSIEKTANLVDVHGQNAALSTHQYFNKQSQYAYLTQEAKSATIKLQTDYFVSEGNAYQQLKAIDTVLARQLTDHTYVWPMSYLPPSIKQPQNYNTPNFAAQTSIKFVLPETLLEQLFERFYQGNYPSYADFKNDVYLHIAKNTLQYLYLLAYFFGATPTAMPDDVSLKRSALQSQRYLDVTIFHSIQSYFTALKTAATQRRPKFLAAPIFLRPQGGDLEYRYGVHHVELSCLDLQSNVPDGIFEYQLQFIKLFLLMALMAPEADDTQLNQATKLFTAVVTEDPTIPSGYTNELTKGLARLQALNQDQLHNSDYAEMLQNFSHFVENNETLPVVQLARAFANTGAFDYGLEVAKKNQHLFLENPYLLRGYSDKSLETQQVLSSSILRGIHYRFLNEARETTELTYQNHRELVMKGTVTGLNPLATHYLLDDEVALKQIMNLNQVAVPKGFVSTDLAEAKQKFQKMFSNQPVVIRPHHPVEHEGIQIFTYPIDDQTFTQAFLTATDYDEEVSVQAFLPGSAYEFYVLNNKVLSVIERVPANVVGDGSSTLENLILQKNDDDRRGRFGHKPLVVLNLDEQMRNFLEKHHLAPETIPERGIQVFLSADPSIQAGGDTYVQTDEIDDSYKQLALQVMKRLHLQQGSVSFWLPNIYEPYKPFQNLAVLVDVTDHPQTIGHSFPYNGPQQHLTNALISQLFPEIKNG